MDLLQGGGYAPITVVLDSAPNPSTYRQAVVFTATVNSSGPTPTGHVIFYNGATSIGNAVVTNGVATLRWTLLPQGPDSITASYNGDANHATGTSSVLIQTVGTGASQPTSTVVTSSGTPTYVGQPVTLTATVSSSQGAPPNGETVTFKASGTIIGRSR